MFKDISEDEIYEFLDCAGAAIRRYQKGEIVISQGDRVESIGILLEGFAQAFKVDFQGNKTLAAQIKEGQIFADLLAAGGHNESPVTIEAKEDITVCLVNWDRILTKCQKNCEKHSRILSNIIEAFSAKFFELFSRIDCLTARSTEAKVLRLLEKYITDPEKGIVILPFDREDMANYLGIDRSSLSRELSKMKKKGLIDYKKHMFVLKTR